MSSNDKGPSDSLDSLFADALKAVEKTKKPSSLKYANQEVDSH